MPSEIAEKTDYFGSETDPWQSAVSREGGTLHHWGSGCVEKIVRMKPNGMYWADKSLLSSSDIGDEIFFPPLLQLPLHRRSRMSTLARRHLSGPTKS